MDPLKIIDTVEFIAQTHLAIIAPTNEARLVKMIEFKKNPFIHNPKINSISDLEFNIIITDLLEKSKNTSRTKNLELDLIRYHYTGACIPEEMYPEFFTVFNLPEHIKF